MRGATTWSEVRGATTPSEARGGIHVVRDDHVVSAGCSGGWKAATTWSEASGSTRAALALDFIKQF